MMDNSSLKNDGSGETPFRFHGGQLYCEKINLNDLVTSHLHPQRQIVEINGQIIKVNVPPTPLFVYAKEALKRNVKAYQIAIEAVGLKSTCRLGYAVKANGNQSLLKTLRSCGVDVLVAVSGNEILAGMSAGYLPSNMIFNGNGKQEWEIKLALELGTMINVDSVFDAERIAQVHRDNCPQNDVKALLRLRPSSQVHAHKGDKAVHPYVNTAEESKFGMGVEEIGRVLDILEKSDIKVFGLHCHLGSCIFDHTIYEIMGDMMKDVMSTLKVRGHEVQLLDVGGGIGIDYKKPIPGWLQKESHETNDESPSIRQFMETIKNSLPISNNVQLILEPGRSLVANSGALISKVLGFKQTPSKSIIVVDGSMAEVIRPCLYNAHHNIFPLTFKEGTLLKKYDVVGPICETADFLGKEVPLPEDTQIFDYVVVMDVGAYCSSMSSNYNMRPRPAEVLVDGSEWRFIRARDTFEDVNPTIVNT